MSWHPTVGIAGFVFGGPFLLLALYSTLSKVTVVIFNPWLLRPLRHRDQPKMFIAVVILYWLLASVGVFFGIAVLTSL